LLFENDGYITNNTFKILLTKNLQCVIIALKVFECDVVITMDILTNKIYQTECEGLK